jgi:PAS domain S-box-containing protein
MFGRVPFWQKLSLAHQSMILLSVFLVSMLWFVSALYNVLEEAEAEAKRQEFARQVSAKASQLLLMVYDTGDAAGKFAYTQQIDATQRYESSSVEVPEIMKWLKTNLKGKKGFSNLLERIQHNMDICEPVIDGVKKQAESLSQEEAIATWRARKDAIADNVNGLVSDLTRLVNVAHKIEEEGPLKERDRREERKNALIFGFAVNGVFAVLIVLFFFSRVTKRVDVIVDNVRRLKAGMPLNEMLDGHDEIAQTDYVFHKTAEDVRREEALLRETERRLRLIIERVPLGLLILNQVGSIELFNKSVEEAFGYEPHELLGKNIAKLFGSAQNQGGARFLATLSERALGHLVELNAVRKSGEEFAIDFTLTEVTFGQNKKRLAIILDATERLELRRLRQSFVTMVSNELRNPLNDVGQFLSNFSSGAYGETSEKATRESERARDNVERLILLLNDLFDLEKLESGRIDIEQRWCSLQPILDKSASAVAVFAQKHKVELDIPTADVPLYADSNRIVQVLINFLSNAIKYSPAGSAVRIAVNESPTAVEVSVIDQGRGIPQSHLHTVFERFQQVEVNDAKKKGGTGLGLAICKAIIEEHGGTIGVNSEVGKGSSFWFKLPAGKKADERAGQSTLKLCPANFDLSLGDDGKLSEAEPTLSGDFPSLWEDEE